MVGMMTHTRLPMVCLMYSPLDVSKTLVTRDNHMFIAFNINVKRMTR